MQHTKGHKNIQNDILKYFFSDTVKIISTYCNLQDQLVINESTCVFFVI